MVLVLAAPATADAGLRFADVVQITGETLATFDGIAIERLGLFACHQQSCAPIPMQVDECDAEGRWVLDHGPEPSADDPPGVLDANDRLLFMAADAGEAVRRDTLPAARPAAQIEVHDPLSGVTHWAYLVAFAHAAPRSPVSYVHYDAARDRVHGAHVSLGFHHGVPGYLAITEARDADGDDAPNLLDRMKVRARATVLWGLIHFLRTEDDLTTQFVGWREGPIRVIRRQRQWVRLGWGIHSPTFGSYTFFFRDFAELPVGLYLNFPPTYFFGDITINAILDFRDLRGWSLLAPGVATPIPIDGTMTAQKRALNQLPASWFALLGPQITLVQSMDVSPSLASVRRRLFYREDRTTSEPPETYPGEEPGIGYQLDDWRQVGAGAHQLQSISYALPADVDVREFMATRGAALQVRVQPVP